MLKRLIHSVSSVTPSCHPAVYITSGEALIAHAMQLLGVSSTENARALVS
jgi:hypothetical protein